MVAAISRPECSVSHSFTGKTENHRGKTATYPIF